MPDIEQDFPDVRLPPLAALIITSISAAVYAGLFVGFAIPMRGQAVALLASFILGSGLLILSYIDMRTGLLLDVLTIPLILLGVGFSIFSGSGWIMSIAGAVLGYGLIFGLGLTWRRTRGYEGIGLGDAKLLAAGGAWLGAPLLPLVLLIASGLGIIFALTVSRKPQKTADPLALPFGPHLSFGIWVTWCVGEMIFANSSGGGWFQ